MTSCDEIMHACQRHSDCVPASFTINYMCIVYISRIQIVSHQATNQHIPRIRSSLQPFTYDRRELTRQASLYTPGCVQRLHATCLITLHQEFDYTLQYNKTISSPALYNSTVSHCIKASLKTRGSSPLFKE